MRVRGLGLLGGERGLGFRVQGLRFRVLGTCFSLGGWGG